MQAKIIFATASLALAFAACNNVDFKKTSAGVPYKLIGDNKGDSISNGHVVKFNFILKTKDTTIGSSYTNGMPQYLQVQPAAAGTPPYSDLAANISEIFRKAHKGDSIYMTFSADSILKQVPAEMRAQVPFKKGQEVMYSARILEVYKTPEEAQAASTKDRIAGSANREKEMLAQMKKDTAFQASLAKDNKIIEDYLSSKGITAQKTDMGVYVQTITAGQGAKPNTGEYANVKYKGMDLTGKSFDEGVYPLQIGMGGSIPGFENGVRQFAKGGKGVIYVPSILGYGKQGSPPKIAPNQVLVFDIEMLDISDKPAPPPPAPVPSQPGGKQ